MEMISELAGGGGGVPVEKLKEVLETALDRACRNLVWGGAVPDGEVGDAQRACHHVVAGTKFNFSVCEWGDVAASQQLRVAISAKCGGCGVELSGSLGLDPSIL